MSILPDLQLPIGQQSNRRQRKQVANLTDPPVSYFRFPPLLFSQLNINSPTTGELKVKHNFQSTQEPARRGRVAPLLRRRWRPWWPPTRTCPPPRPECRDREAIYCKSMSTQKVNFVACVLSGSDADPLPEPGPGEDGLDASRDQLGTESRTAAAEGSKRNINCFSAWQLLCTFCVGRRKYTNYLRHGLICYRLRLRTVKLIK